MQNCHINVCSIPSSHSFVLKQKQKRKENEMRRHWGMQDNMYLMLEYVCDTKVCECVNLWGLKAWSIFYVFTHFQWISVSIYGIKSHIIYKVPFQQRRKYRWQYQKHEKRKMKWTLWNALVSVNNSSCD